MTRLTRKEQQARTRSGLIDAAVRVFCRHGLHRGSVEQVAAEAGFTKGAFYSNFRSKEELFLAILDDRFAERIRVLDELLAGDAPFADQAREGGAEFQDYLRGAPEWERLFFEFAAYAARDEAFRVELVARYRMLIDRLAEAIQRRADAAGLTPPGDVRVFALGIFAAGNGVALQQLLDPDEMPPDLFPELLELLTLGMLAKAGALPARGATPPRR